MKHHESSIAKALVQWYGLRYPKYCTALIHIPNGAALGGNPIQRAKQGHRLKLEGMRPGASDYFLALPRGGYGGLWLELKAIGKVPTAEQMTFLHDRAAAGYSAQWAAGIDAARNAITEYMALT